MSKYIGTPVVSLSTDTVDVTGDITTTDATPEVIIVNDTHEDTDGGREGKVTFKGQQSGGEETTLAEIQASHDGTSDDEKGDLIFKTNDGSDGASPTERMRIDSVGTVTITNASNDSQLILESTDADADSGPVLELFRNSASPADDDLVGAIEFHGENDADEKIQYGLIAAKLQDASDGTEDVRLSFKTITAGTERERITIQPTEVVINEDSQDLDFRVESDTVANALFVQGSDGNVGIGVTPSDDFGFTRALDIGSTGGAFVYLRDTDATNSIGGIGQSGTRMYVVNKAAGPMTFQVNGDANERMRISQNGYVGIGRTDPVQRLDVHAGTANQWAGRFRHDGFGGVNYILNFDNSGGLIGSITGNGSNVAYNTSSDYRLKENIVDLDGATARLKQLQPRRFNFIDNDSLGTIDGFIAHEAQSVVSEAVTGTKDEVEVWKDGDDLPDGASVGDNKLDDNGNTIPLMQGIDQSKLVPLLTAALQEAIAKIETLETKVAALEGE